MIASAFRGRLPASAWYPANEPQLRAREVALGGGERARIVEGGEPDAEPVVFVHGWGCSAYFFRKLLPATLATGRRVIALDLRGHGGSSKPADPACYTGEAMRDFAREVLDTIRVHRAHFVAHS
jgi:pimeloyl-ACP methyl ester carboxylesterase